MDNREIFEDFAWNLEGFIDDINFVYTRKYYFIDLYDGVAYLATFLCAMHFIVLFISLCIYWCTTKEER